MNGLIAIESRISVVQTMLQSWGKMKTALFYML